MFERWTATACQQIFRVIREERWNLFVDGQQLTRIYEQRHSRTAQSFYHDAVIMKDFTLSSVFWRLRTWLLGPDSVGIFWNSYLLLGRLLPA